MAKKETATARAVLNREGVFDLLAGLVVFKQTIERPLVSETTIITDPIVPALLAARLKYVEGVVFEQQCLRWRDGLTVGGVLDALGLINGKILPRAQTHGRKAEAGE